MQKRNPLISPNLNPPNMKNSYKLDIEFLHIKFQKKIITQLFNKQGHHNQKSEAIIISKLIILLKIGTLFKK